MVSRFDIVSEGIMTDRWTRISGRFASFAAHQPRIVVGLSGISTLMLVTMVAGQVIR